jgi:hypothetical protein
MAGLMVKAYPTLDKASICRMLELRFWRRMMRNLLAIFHRAELRANSQ